MNHTKRVLQGNHPSKKQSFFGSTVMWALLGLLLGGVFAVVSQGTVEAAACPAATTDLGTDTITVNIPAQATYTVWTRMKAPDTTHNSIALQVDAATCFNVGGGTFTATAWNADASNWIKYSDGAASSINSVPLTAGTHTLKYIGTQAGVEVDRVILASDASCTPTGTGDNCQSGDSTPPTVSLTSPTASQSVTGILNMAATASDASGIAQVKFMVDGTAVNTDTTAPYTYAWNSAAVANGSHSVTAQATDTAGVSATSAAITITTNNSVTCSGTPSVPTNLKVNSTTGNSVTLGWTASTAATACSLDGYKIYRNGTLVTTAPGTTFTDTGLTPNVTYSYTISAVDTSGHESAKTAAVTGVTSGDSVKPTAPNNLRSTMIGSNSVALAWNASTDNTGVTGYDVLRNGTKVGTATATAYTDNGLSANTTYSYTVVAKDAAGNTSDPSPALSVKTITGSSSSNGDLNGSGKIDVFDLSIMLAHWGAKNAPVTDGELNGDGKIDVFDLSIMLKNWTK